MLFKGFGKGSLRFFEELAANNNRTWWLANKDWYENDVRAPLEHLLADLADEFGEAKVFRANRDIRFSADKSPYKTQAAAAIGSPHSVAVLYVQLAADGIRTAGGTYMPPRDELARLREAIDDDKAGPDLEAIVADLRTAGCEVTARDSVKTAPRGYPADHPRIELLRGKGIIGSTNHAPAAWLYTAKVRDKVAQDWRRLGPLNDWLERNVNSG